MLKSNEESGWGVMRLQGVRRPRGELAACRAPARILAGLFVAVLAMVPANAAPKTKAQTAENTVPEVPDDDIFGFSAATGVGEKGDLAFANELNGARGKRDGSYLALSNKMELGYTFAENWWIAGSAFVSNHHIRGVTGLEDVSGTTFEALSFEVQFRFLQRSASNPFALAVAVEPFRSFVDFTSGQRSDTYGAAFKLLTDAVIVPDKVYWAANAIWVPQRSQSIEDRSQWLRTSGSSLSTALTFQLSKGLFVGAEARHLASYDGGWLEDRVGYAVYVGPTFLWKITEKVVFNATWQPQVYGHSIDNPQLRYDLDSFDRAQFRAKLTVAFN
jgi:hypothetical protein